MLSLNATSNPQATKMNVQSTIEKFDTFLIVISQKKYQTISTTIGMGELTVAWTKF